MLLANEAERDTTKPRELIMTMSPFSNTGVGIQFKAKITKKTYLRLAIMSINYDGHDLDLGQNSPTREYQNFGGGVKIGVEKRKSLASTIQAFAGFNLLLRGNITSFETVEDYSVLSVTSGFTTNAGAIARLLPNMYLGIEVEPRMEFSYTKQKARNQTPFPLETYSSLFSFSGNDVRLLLIYRWGKRQEKQE